MGYWQAPKLRSMMRDSRRACRAGHAFRRGFIRKKINLIGQMRPGRMRDEPMKSKDPIPFEIYHILEHSCMQYSLHDLRLA